MAGRSDHMTSRGRGPGWRGQGEGPGFAPPSEPGESVGMGHRGQYSAREQMNDQIKLRQLNRLIDMDEDQSLSTFEGSNIQEQLGAGIRRHDTQSRQRVARATQVARRRGVTPYPIPTSLQAHEARWGIDHNVLEPEDYDRLVPSAGSYLSQRDRDIHRLRNNVRLYGRLEHLGIDSGFGVSEPSVFDDIETNRSETADRSRLVAMERLEEMDRDPSLQAFENSSIQHQLGAGIVTYD